MFCAILDNVAKCKHLTIKMCKIKSQIATPKNKVKVSLASKQSMADLSRSVHICMAALDNMIVSIRFRSIVV